MGLVPIWLIQVLSRKLDLDLALITWFSTNKQASRVPKTCLSIPAELLDWWCFELTTKRICCCCTTLGCTLSDTRETIWSRWHDQHHLVTNEFCAELFILQFCSCTPMGVLAHGSAHARPSAQRKFVSVHVFFHHSHYHYTIHKTASWSIN